MEDESLRVSFQGELGAFSHLAAIRFFGKNVKLVPLPTFRDVFESTLGKVDFAVVPIENSRSGDIGENIDLLYQFDCSIFGEVILPVRHCLIIHKDSSLSKIKKIISHPQAFAQCTKFLNKYGKEWQKVPTYDTAGAVKSLAEERLLDTAAIASELACRIYHMKLVMKGIEDDPNNVTRFVVIGNAKSKLKRKSSATRYKTSVIFLTEHKPGSLVNALRCFSDRGINLLKIVSRPIEGKHWEYSFYIEFAGNLQDENCSQAVKELAERAIEVKLLGSYPS